MLELILRRIVNCVDRKSHGYSRLNIGLVGWHPAERLLEIKF